MRWIEADGRDCLRVSRHLCVFRCYRHCWRVLFIRYRVDFKLHAATPNPSVLSVCSRLNFLKLDQEAGTEPLLAHLVHVQSAPSFDLKASTQNTHVWLCWTIFCISFIYYDHFGIRADSKDIFEHTHKANTKHPGWVPIKLFFHSRGNDNNMDLSKHANSTLQFVQQYVNNVVFVFGVRYLPAAQWQWIIRKMQLLTVLPTIIGALELQVHTVEYVSQNKSSENSCLIRKSNW